MRLVSDAQAGSIASAMIERYELDAERGFAVVPMNVGQELWDYVKVTDSRQNDTRVGNIQFIRRDVAISFTGAPLTWTMMIAFGKVSTQSLMANLAVAGASVSGGMTGSVSYADLMDIVGSIYDDMNEIIDFQNKIVDKVNEIVSDAVLKKLTVTESLNIPVWS